MTTNDVNNFSQFFALLKRKVIFSLKRPYGINAAFMRATYEQLPLRQRAAALQYLMRQGFDIKEIAAILKTDVDQLNYALSLKTNDAWITRNE